MTERTNNSPRSGRYAGDPPGQPVSGETPEQHGVLGMTDQEPTRQWSVRTETRTEDSTRSWESGELPLADHDQPPTAEIRPVREPQQSISDSAATARARGANLRGLLDATTGIWIGLALVAAGFVAIFYSWTKVAGLVNVALQMPYVVSGATTGLALVIVGVAVVDVAVRRQDSHERAQQLAQVSRTLGELHDLLEPDQVPADEQYWDEQR